MINRKYSLDYPKNGDSVNEIFRCSGWDLSNKNEICVSINGLPSFALCRSFREDLGIEFPKIERSVDKGFYGDVVLPKNIGERVKLGLSERIRKKWITFHEILVRHETEFDLKTLATSVDGQVETRKRSYCLESILSWPGNGGNNSTKYEEHVGRENRILKEGIETYSLLGVPHFHKKDSLPLLRLKERGFTHPYGSRSNQIIKNVEGLVLDVGAGITDPNNIPDNIVLLDAVHYPNLDVVSTCPTIPFRNCCFDAVISQAVFEHLEDPFLMAREVHRVLRPGGVFYLTTAFMQPLHGDPSHYFNMTMNGLRKVLADFIVEEIGVEPFQYPSYGIQMAIEAVLPYTVEGETRGALQKALEYVMSKRTEFDDALTSKGRETMAAGIFAVARKSSSIRVS